MEPISSAEFDPKAAEQVFEAFELVTKSFQKELGSSLKLVIARLGSDIAQISRDMIGLLPIGQIQQSIKIAAEAAKAIKPAYDMQQIAQAFESVRFIPAVAEIAQQLDSFAKKNAEAIRATYEATFSSIRNLSEAQKEYKEASKRYSIIMIMAEWPPLLDIPAPAIYEIIKEYERMPFDQFKTELNNAIVAFYDRENLERKIKKWKGIPLLSRESILLEEVIKGHLEGKYNLAVPTALSQFEGIIADIYKHKGKMNFRNVRTYLEDLLDNRISKSPYDIVKSLILREVLQQFRWGDSISSPISRHAILHGAKTDYGDECSSLKTILILDYLVHYYEKKQKEEHLLD